MNADTYAPQEETLAHRVCAYFKRLPDEELSVTDICTKWSTSSVDAKLVRSVEAGLLVRDGSVYSAGPNISGFDISVRPMSDPLAVKRGLKARKNKGAFSVNLADIQIITDKPMVNVIKPKVVDWSSKFDAMEVGHWFALPAEGKSSVSKAARLYKSSTQKCISVRTMEDGSLCVGRIA